MFSSVSTSTLGQRALGALRLTRSFLLLEDDYDVDWEVDLDERPAANHPHRAPLRGRAIPRRHGRTIAREQVCLCPVSTPLTRRDDARLRVSPKQGSTRATRVS
jgi:hypothetical protein